MTSIEMSESPPRAGFLRLPQVLEIIPVSRSRWYSGVKSGEFPAPIRISANISVWRAAEIQALVERLGDGNRVAAGKRR